MNFKKLFRFSIIKKPYIKGLSRIIRASVFLSVVCSFQLIAENLDAQTVNIRLETNELSVRQLISDIENQTDFLVLFRNNDIDVERIIRLKNTTGNLMTFLDETFRDTDINYKFQNKYIVLSKQPFADEVAQIFQQSGKRITGMVTDMNGEIIIGANIIEKGTTNGTVTDADGNFNLNVAENAVLQVSYVGYITQEINVSQAERDVLRGRGNVIIIRMSDDMQALEEVVVVGYGTQKKVNLIGSVAQISSERLENRPVGLLSNALTGELTGVTIIQRSGKPGDSGGQIRVRGVGSFGASPDALILIDGIPGTLNEINPDDIETISVLKDASSAAIYGARAANGVVLITTKKGKEGRINVSYNGYVGWERPTEFPELASSWEYATMYNEAIGREVYSEDVIQKYKSGTDPDNYPNTNFLEETFTRQGIQTGHDLSLTGGTASNRYFASFGYLSQEGLVERNNYRRYNSRLNLTSDIFSNLTLVVNLSGSVEERSEPQTVGALDIANLEGIVNHAVRLPSIYVGKYQNGDFGSGPMSVGTPAAWLASDSYRRRPVTRISANSKLGWKVTEDITLSGIVGYNYSIEEEYSFRASQRLNENLTLPISFLNESRNKRIYKTAQSSAEYAKVFDGHDVDLLLAYAFEAEDIDYFNGYRQQFPSNDYTVMDMGSAENQRSGGYLEGWSIQSYFGRFKYNYNQKYLFETTVRFDGSSRFPKDKKFGTFPSLAAGWRVSEESFFAPLRPVLSNFKLKASWGILGNQNISNYPYQSTLSSGLNYSFGGAAYTGAGLTQLKDPLLHWESTRTADAGVEIGLFNGLVNLNASYFYRHTYDILYKPSASVSTVLGLELSEINTGKMDNKGFEFDISHQNRFKDFRYKISANLSIIHNEVMDLGVGNVEQPNGLVGNGSNLFIGYPMEMYYGYFSDGVFLDDADIAAWPDQTKVTTNPRAGDIRYKDINGPEGKPDGVVDPTYDRTYLGSRIPQYTYAFNLDLGYKGFDIRAFFQGVAGVKGYLDGYVGYAFYNLGSIQKWQIDGRYNPANPQRYVEYPRLEILTNSLAGNYVQSDFWALNASYLRIKNLQVGYTLPQSIVQPSHINRLRIYFSADNLYTFKKYRKGWDPEINTGGAYYPILATYVFGINMNF
ncbi:MAG: TonB-dependent receptor [Dysgonamonadaceae bacterium]|nr:TonB-dependent receptor [Dysgonamonadaceae bacterium]